MIPVITLVGRPNVGKSTLFNRLTRTRDALVADFPGLTRDRQYGIGRLGTGRYIVVDTGGLSGARDGVEMLMDQQIRQAVDEADHLIFLVDGQDGCTAVDIEIAATLRRAGKPLTLVVNKADHGDPDLLAAEFYALGLDRPTPISATQGRGVAGMIDDILSTLAPAETETEALEQTAGIRIAIVGRPNAGKSTLINRLIGEDRLVTFDSPGTTRDSISIPFEQHGKHYTLIDTAGVRRRAKVHDAIEKFSVIKTLQAIEECNVVILVVDAHAGIGEQDATLAGHIIDSGRALVVAINKWDGLDHDEREAIHDQLSRKLAFLGFAASHFISALHGSGVGLLLDEANDAYANATRDLATPELTRILEETVQEHQPPLVHGRRIKLRYAHQGGRNPPIIVIHGNQTEHLPDTYRRYLINRFRQILKLDGTPLRLELKTGSNPYQGRKNKLSPRQMAKRRRLQQHVKGKR